MGVPQLQLHPAVTADELFQQPVKEKCSFNCCIIFWKTQFIPAIAVIQLSFKATQFLVVCVGVQTISYPTEHIDELKDRYELHLFFHLFVRHIGYGPLISNTWQIHFLYLLSLITPFSWFSYLLWAGLFQNVIHAARKKLRKPDLKS